MKQFFLSDYELVSWRSSFSATFNNAFTNAPLTSFIDKIELIEELSDDTLTPTFIAFLKSKLEGKARVSLPAQINTVSQIKEALRGQFIVLN